MKPAKFKRYSVMAQIGLWLILFTVMFVDSLVYDDGFNGFLFAANFVVINVIMVYLHYWLILPLFIKRKRITYFCVVIPFLLFFSCLIFLMDWILPYDYPDDVEVESFLEMFAYTLPIGVLLLAGSSLYYFIEQWFQNIDREANLKNQKLEAELNFLKSQINPHFLFNTLNNIYSYVQMGNEKSGPMLERLSSVLRFMVYDCTSEQVELTKELTAIEDLLEINKMKNSEQENITLTSSGVKGFHLVAPLILVNLVENACKHSNAVSNPEGFIKVDVNINDQDECICEIANSVKPKSNLVQGEVGGVGLQNVMQRLELQYGDRYSFEKIEENNVYRLILKLPLERKK